MMDKNPNSDPKSDPNSDPNSFQIPSRLECIPPTTSVTVIDIQYSYQHGIKYP